MSLATGQTLSFYEILAPLGAGGMGEVYRARDTRLEREVAIKVLPDELAEDEERLRRFEREAKTLATLHHPNVASIFGIDQVGDTCFLALELVPGQDLAELVARGPLPVEEALAVCRQIAEGLEAAHEAGVVHRDLKPANVRVTPEGVAKVLDFGLAKPMPRDPSGSTAQSDSFLATADGRVLGTPTYMSPEQARGRPVDRRTDIWAFGCVLYECLVGRRAFAGENLADILSAIVGTEPDLAALPPATPPRVRELVRRCLEKDPRRRLRDIGEARLTLDDPGASVAEAIAPARAGRRFLPWALAGGLALALAAVLWSDADPADAPARSNAHLAITLPPGDLLQVTKGQAERGMLALSPDGRRVVYAVVDGQSSRLAVREIDSFEARVLPGTTGGSTPFFSPDGEWVGFFAGGKLKKVPVGGGEPLALCDAGLERGASGGRTARSSPPSPPRLRSCSSPPTGASPVP